MADEAAIGELWAWWSARGRELAELPEPAEAADEITARVAAVHPGLEWEIGPGVTARWAFVVSSGGVPELRPLAERCVRSGPRSGDRWEFHAARPPAPVAMLAGALLDIGRGEPLALDACTVAAPIDEPRCRIDVTVFLPRFGELRAGDRGQVVFRLLDLLLGEDDVVRWVGRVDTATAPPPGAVRASALPGVVAGLARRTPLDTWATGTVEGRGGPRSVTVRRPLCWIDTPG